MTLPPDLQQIVDVMRSSPKEFRIEALLDFASRIPPLPPGISSEELESVPECQTPFFLATRIEGDGMVRMFFDAPPESPTVRGYAGILHKGLDGQPVEVILAVPDDFYIGMGLEEVVSPLRLRGMAAILGRLKHQIRRQLER